MTDPSFATRAVRHREIRGPVDPVATPIYLSSTYVLDSASHGADLCSRRDPGDHSPWLYTRWGNPTSDVANRVIADLEQGADSLVTTTGMAAITSALFAFLKSGDHCIAPLPVYGGTHEVFDKVFPDLGIEVTYVDGTDPLAYGDAIRSNTKVLYGETPANPTMSVLDLTAFGDLGRSRGIITMVDSTFASPYNQQPIRHGVDISIHSATKYLGGHSDIVAGAVVSRTAQQHKDIFRILKLFGGTQSPFDSFLLVRGMKTLDVRMQRHNENAMTIARFLEGHEGVARVYYPGLESHPQHLVAKNQMRGFGGMVAFDVKGGTEAGTKLIENLNTIVLAVSLGGVESLVEHAASMTHTMVPREERLKGGITDGLIRLSVGLEACADLIADLTQALALI